MLLSTQKREKWGKRHMDKDFLFPSYTFPAPDPNAMKTDLLKNGWDVYQCKVDA